MGWGVLRSIFRRSLDDIELSLHISYHVVGKTQGFLTDSVVPNLWV